MGQVQLILLDRFFNKFDLYRGDHSDWSFAFRSDEIELLNWMLSTNGYISLRKHFIGQSGFTYFQYRGRFKGFFHIDFQSCEGERRSGPKWPYYRDPLTLRENDALSLLNKGMLPHPECFEEVIKELMSG